MKVIRITYHTLIPPPPPSGTWPHSPTQCQDWRTECHGAFKWLFWDGNVEIERDVRVTHVRHTFAVQSFLLVRRKCLSCSCSKTAVLPPCYHYKARTSQIAIVLLRPPYVSLKGSTARIHQSYSRLASWLLLSFYLQDSHRQQKHRERTIEKSVRPVVIEAS